MKKVKGVKEKAQAAEEAERRKQTEAKSDSDKENATNGNADEPASKNVLGDEGDEDVIF